ncbi:FKBP-type peptidyl-prolyl cis-trans isomerase [Calditrichota bacterium]
MRKYLIVIVALLIGCQGAAVEKVSLDNDVNKTSYAIGVDLGKNFKGQMMEVNPDALAMGLREALAEGDLQMTEEEMQAAIMQLQQSMQEKQNETRKAMTGKNKTEGEAFLKENATKEGVKTTASGLQYKVIKAGTGKTPGLNDTVETHYRGTLIDGTVFDSSYDRGETATFPVSGVISGWTEALQMMKEGGTWQLYIPSELAYGSRGAGGKIGPDAVLIFDIELIAVK